MAQRNQARPSDILSLYTQDAARFPLLTIQQERQIGALALAGSRAAQEQLVVANLRFVISVAKRYNDHGIPLLDLIAAGNIGLMHAARKFDPERCVHFISYAVHWIRQSIQREIDTSNGTVRATLTQMVRVRRVRRLDAQARQRVGHELAMQEMIDCTGYTVARIEEARNYRVTISSIDEPANGNDRSQTTLCQMIAAEDTRATLDHGADVQARVHQVCTAVLSPRERQVVEYYFGVGGRSAMSLSKIGTMWKISRERARQLKERALKKLRRATEYHPELFEVFQSAASVDWRRQHGLRGRTEPAADLGSDPGFTTSDVATTPPMARAEGTRAPGPQRVRRNALGQFERRDEQARPRRGLRCGARVARVSGLLTSY